MSPSCPLSLVEPGQFRDAFASFELAFSEPGGWRILIVSLPVVLALMALVLRWAIAALRRGAAATGSPEQ